jgi:hypothetical protein
MILVGITQHLIASHVFMVDLSAPQRKLVAVGGALNLAREG